MEDLLSGAGEADVQSLDLAEPALFGRLADSLLEVVDYLGETQGLGGVRSTADESDRVIGEAIDQHRCP